MSFAHRLPWFDALATAAVLALATLWWPGAMAGSPAAIAVRGAIVVAIALTAFYYNDLYDFETPHEAGELFLRVTRALGYTGLGLAGAYAVFPAIMLDVTATSHALLLALAMVPATRLAVYALAKRPPFAERVLVVGTHGLAGELAEQIRARPDLALTLVGYVGEGDASDVGPHLGGYADLDDAVRRTRPDRIIVAMPDRRGTLPVAPLLTHRFHGIRVEDSAQAFERITQRLPVQALTPGALVFGDGFRVSRLQRGLQRGLSVALAATGLVLAAPLMALIAVAIRLESPGPVLFIQERVGRGGHRFRLLKFRTMRVLDAHEEALWQRDNRSRVTRVGRVLRTYRLDELPQFINILRGDMNFVGPRPEMASNVDAFAAVVPFYMLRHAVRPGLTGWAQVRAGYSMTTEEVTRKLCYDLYYIKHASLAFDLKILVDTVKFVASGKRPG